MSVSRYLVLAGMLLALVPGASTAQRPVLNAQVASLLEATVDAHDLPGATAVYVLSDGTVGGAAAGFADPETETPMTEGALMLDLPTEGALSLDDPLSRHLGDRVWIPRLPNADAITLRHLLRHESGLPDHVHLPAFQAEAVTRFRADGTPFSPEELVGFVLDAPPLFAPGAGWAYGDTGYVLLGLVIEAVTGEAYYDAADARLIVPLGLADTVRSDRPDIERLAVGHTTEDNPFGLPARTSDTEGRLVWNPASEWAGGGYASTARDLAQWGAALYGGLALGATYLDDPLDGAPVGPDAPGSAYGAGTAIYGITSRGPVYGHGGWIPGYVSSLRHYADHDVTVAFMLSTDVGAGR